MNQREQICSGTFLVFCKWTYYHVWGSVVARRQMLFTQPWKRAWSTVGPSKLPRERRRGRACGHVGAAPIRNCGLLLSQYNCTTPGLSPKHGLSLRPRRTHRGGSRTAVSRARLTHCVKLVTSICAAISETSVCFPVIRVGARTELIII